MRKLVSTAGVLFVAVACANPGARHPVAADAVPQAPRQSPQPTADAADVVVRSAEEEAAARVGQTIGVKPFVEGVRWQVSFSDDALQLLTPLDRLATPGDQGWVWKALMPGVIEITFTTVAVCADPPCAPNVQRYTVTLRISG